MTTSAPPHDEEHDLLTDALSAVPGRARLADALADIERRRLTVPEAPDPNGVADEAVVALIAGDPVDLDALGEHAADRAWHAERTQWQRQALDRVIEGLRRRLERIDRDGLDTALDHLDGVLRNLVDDARAALSTLGNISTADQAIDAGVGEQWRRAVKLAERIEALRHAQVDLIEPHGYQSQVDADAAVRLWGSLTRPERAADPDTLVDLERRFRRDQTRPDPAWTDPTVAGLRVFVDHDGGPRVATLAELRATAKRVRGLATGPAPAASAPAKQHTKHGLTNAVAGPTPDWPRHDGAPPWPHPDPEPDPATGGRGHPAPAGQARGQMLGASRKGGTLGGWEASDPEVD